MQKKVVVYKDAVPKGVQEHGEVPETVCDGDRASGGLMANMIDVVRVVDMPQRLEYTI